MRKGCGRFAGPKNEVKWGTDYRGQKVKEDVSVCSLSLYANEQRQSSRHTQLFKCVLIEPNEITSTSKKKQFMKKKKINEETMTNNEMKQTIDNKGKEELNNDA